MVLVPATMELLGDAQLVAAEVARPASCPNIDVEGTDDDDEIDAELSELLERATASPVVTRDVPFSRAARP